MSARSLSGSRLWLGLFGILGLASLPFGRAAPPPAPVAPTVDFNRQVLPILSDNCFACHGPDAKQRKAKLRLDTREGAFGALKSGDFPIVPGKADDSAIIERITSDDPHRHMPPAKTGKQLTPEQVALLRQWIDQGAKWSKHWAWVPPERPVLPEVHTAWPRNPIDYFVLARLEREGLQPSAEADKATLLRRVTLDLTGLPPTPAEVDAFLADHSAEAYVKVVDRLLRSPRYGEHMARYWLDAARYGDTHGLHLDNFREMWPYREWVIKAFNANLPFDQFVTRQLAGDLMPGTTTDDVVASGFNRCHVTTSEGGSIEEECYVRNVVDRVDTTGTVFLGLSIGCARCHDHKYDPITQKDYYSLFAVFNSLDEKPLDGNAPRPAPILKVPSPEQGAQLAELDVRLAAKRKAIADQVAKVPYDDGLDASQGEYLERADHVWLDDDYPPGTKPANAAGAWTFVSRPEHPVKSGTRSLRGVAQGTSQQVFHSPGHGLKVGEGDTLFAYVFLNPGKPPKEIMLQWHAGDWKYRAYWGQNLISFGKDGTAERLHAGPLPKTGKWVRLEVDADKLGLKPGTVIDGWAFTQHDGTVYWDRAGLETWTPQEGQPIETLSTWVRLQRATGGAGLPKSIKDLVELDRSQRTDGQKKELRAYFLEYAYPKARAIFAPLHRQLAATQKQRDDLDRLLPATLVSHELPTPRPAYILKRGEYDKRGVPVGRATPAFLPPPRPGTPRDRLGFARWLLAPENPLTARVEVNRLWQHCFGTGLVKTAEDFGTQGEPPSHPELLDWLAVQFREDGWDVKRIMKLIVTSATYRQASRTTPDRLAKDPANRLLARGPRFRLDAEALRDQALAVSGLLVEKVGGPSVKPPQPSGLWEAVGYLTSNTRNFAADHGAEKVHRRSVYTFWKRTAPPPQMTTFDAPSREACRVRRERTNTPLQALLLLNDEQYVECARVLAERTLKEAGPKPEDRLAYLFRLAAARRPDERELAELAAAWKDHRDHYRRDTEAARKLIAVGETKPDPALDPAELAAYTMVANLVLNLDEVINKG
jgi:mono/diheme cytochrome c family protein